LKKSLLAKINLLNSQVLFFNRIEKNFYYVIKYLGVAQGQACTIVLRGATQQILDEAERSIHDVLCVLSQTVKEPRICYGGGSLKISSF
jgi:chaperonin GroEL (HSP60 family)